MRRANVYRIRGEQIVEVWIFEGDQYAVDDFSLTSRPRADTARQRHRDGRVLTTDKMPIGRAAWTVPQELLESATS